MIISIEHKIQIRITHRRSYIVVPSLLPWFKFHSMAPALTLCECMFVFASLCTCTLYPMLSLAVIHLCLSSQVLTPAAGRTESPDRALHVLVSHMIGKGSIFPFFIVHLDKLLSATNLRLPTTKIKCSNVRVEAVVLSIPMMLLCCSFACSCSSLRNLCWPSKF